MKCEEHPETCLLTILAVKICRHICLLHDYFGDTTPTFPAEGNASLRYSKAIILYRTSTTLKQTVAATMFPEYVYKIEVTLTITTCSVL